MVSIAILVALLSYKNLVKSSESGFRSTFQKTLDCNGQTGCALELPSSVETEVKTKIWCAMICKIQMNCTSFNYLENNKTCQLFNFAPFKITSSPQCYNYMLSMIALPTSGNLALKRETCLSSTANTTEAICSSWLAVDDLFGTDELEAQCAQTNDPDGGENWFMVDLRQTVVVSQVRVLMCDCQILQSRYENLIIGLTNDSWIMKRPVRNTYPLCGIYSRTPTVGDGFIVSTLTANIPNTPNDFGKWIEVNCSTNGNQPVRYVIVQQTPSNDSTFGGSMILCEVQVFKR